MRKLNFSRFLIRRMLSVMASVIVLCTILSIFCSYAVNNNIQKHVDNLFNNYHLQLISLKDYYQYSSDVIYDNNDFYLYITDPGHEYPYIKNFHFVFAVTDEEYTEIITVSAQDSYEENNENYCLLSVLKDDLLSYGISTESIDDYFVSTASTYDTDNRILKNSYGFSLGEDYYLFNCVYSYDFSETSGYTVQIIWAVGLFIGIAVSVILSLIAYSKYRAQYEIDEFRRNMTSALAHDLKTPLTAVMGYAENLRDNIHTEKKEHYADAVIENVKYMNGIITSTLDLARLEGQDGIKLDETDILSLAEGLFSKYRANAEDRGIRIKLEGKCRIKADRELISRAVENLISNAVKYSCDGGEIKITADDKSFCIENTCDISLKGNTEVFCKPFYKADESRSERNGDGIGLAAVKNITAMHRFAFAINAENGLFKAEIKFR